MGGGARIDIGAVEQQNNGAAEPPEVQNEVSVRGDTLFVSGLIGVDDVITISESGDNLIVALNGTNSVVDNTGITEINIVSFSGDDRITVDQNSFSSFNSLVDAGDGDDRVVIFGEGDSLVFGGGGNDTLFGGEGRDILSGDDGNDILQGFEGDDQLFGGGGNDILRGLEGDDELFGGGGDDELDGGEDDDRLVGDDGDDELIGQLGDDCLLYTSDAADE